MLKRGGCGFQSRDFANVMNLGLTQNENQRSVVVLAPSLSAVPAAFTRAGVDRRQYNYLLEGMQRLRGAVYLEDGAIGADQLTSDGLHSLPVDEHSWHILSLDDFGRVSGCVRYQLHSPEVAFSELGVAKSALAGSSRWGQLLRLAVNTEVAAAKRAKLGFAEVGGWALDRQQRCTAEALRVVLGTYSLASILGECIGVSTATVRNCSASILKRIGGTPMQFDGYSLPAYHDPHYNCDMEIIRFDSRRPAERFSHWIDQIRRQMLEIPVICPTLRSHDPLPRHDRYSHRTVHSSPFMGVSAA